MSSVKNVRLVWPEDLHRLVKAHAASLGVPLSAFVEGCVRAGLREAGVVRPPVRVAPVAEDVTGVVDEEPLVPDGFAVKSTAGVDGFARAARDPAVVEAVEDLDKLRQTRVELEALKARSVPDRPVRALSKEEQVARKKGRGRS